MPHSSVPAVAEILRLRAPLSLQVLRAALKGKRVLLTEEELLAILSSGGFVEGPPGQWSLAPVSSAAPAPARFNQASLASRAGVDGGVLLKVLEALVTDHPEVNWGALRDRLESGADVAVSERTLGLLEEGVRRFEVARLRAEKQRAEERTREAERRRELQQLAESEVAMLRAELDDERRRAHDAAVERDRLRQEAEKLVALKEQETAAWVATAAGGWMLDLGAPETFGEEKLRQALGQLESALVVLNVPVAGREIEAVVVHPGGIAVVEQYDIPSTAGVVSVPASGTASVEDRALEVSDPRGEVLGAVRVLQKAVSLDLTYLPVVAFQGPADAEGEDVLVCLTAEVDLAVDDLLHSQPSRVSADDAITLLAKLGVPDLPEPPSGF
ncbi:hypothetical protein [Nocardioides albus]|uniref:Uncharacterized protein n=1 Tax=Nocardioides albus TaxID=1841 RepID=A0A7W5F6T8_9ACTN|nr:hypothetical protein [Nocardioides albus]MBB3087503.1 hypothetical protein [Nocardioides albus]GGU09462.1 hypothetical protein GCM10007979_04260 [Nocardioides albus]